MGARAVLTHRRPAGGPLWLATLEVPEDVAAAYVAPGQYVQVRTAGGDGYFALASEPGGRPFELLVRNNGEASAVLATAAMPVEVEVVGPLGHRFPMARAEGRELLVAVAGSAIAVARPVLRARIAHGEGPRTHLFVGARAPSELPLVDELEAWAEASNVVLCLSRAEVDHDPEIVPRAARRAGYVQAALEAFASREGQSPAAPIVFAAGPAEMLADVKAFGRSAMRGGVSFEVVANA